MAHIVSDPPGILSGFTQTERLQFHLEVLGRVKVVEEGPRIKEAIVQPVPVDVENTNRGSHNEHKENSATPLRRSLVREHVPRRVGVTSLLSPPPFSIALPACYSIVPMHCITYTTIDQDPTHSRELLIRRIEHKVYQIGQ